LGSCPRKKALRLEKETQRKNASAHALPSLKSKRGFNKDNRVGVHETSSQEDSNLSIRTVERGKGRGRGAKPRKILARKAQISHRKKEKDVRKGKRTFSFTAGG